MSQRLRPLLLSLLFLFVSLGAYQTGANYLERPSAPADSPAGTWQQFALVEGEQPVYLATFHFKKSGCDYQVEALDVAPETQPQKDFYTFGHRFDGERWRFHSDWHEYGVAEFDLRKVAEDRFEGYAYLDGVARPYRNILVRVGK